MKTVIRIGESLTTIECEVTAQAYEAYQVIRSLGLNLTLERLAGDLIPIVCVMIEHTEFGEFDLFVSKADSSEFDTKLNDLLCGFDPVFYHQWLSIEQNRAPRQSDDLDYYD